MVPLYVKAEGDEEVSAEASMAVVDRQEPLS